MPKLETLMFLTFPVARNFCISCLRSDETGSGERDLGLDIYNKS